MTEPGDPSVTDATNTAGRAPSAAAAHVGAFAGWPLVALS